MSSVWIFVPKLFQFWKLIFYKTKLFSVLLTRKADNLRVLFVSQSQCLSVVFEERYVRGKWSHKNKDQTSNVFYLKVFNIRQICDKILHGKCKKRYLTQDLKKQVKLLKNWCLFWRYHYSLYRVILLPETPTELYNFLKDFDEDNFNIDIEVIGS